MYRLASSFIAVVVFLLAGCDQTKFESVPADQVDKTQQVAAETFTNTVLMAWNENKTVDVQALCSEEMGASFTSVDQEVYARKNLELFGKFKSMTFVEARKSVPAQFIIYRFKGVWEKKQGWEVRVVYDTKGKVSGFWAKPWKDSV